MREFVLVKQFSLWWPLGIGVVVAIALGIFYVSRGGEWTWPAISLLVLTAVFQAVRVYSGRRARALGQELRRRRESKK